MTLPTKVFFNIARNLDFFHCTDLNTSTVQILICQIQYVFSGSTTRISPAMDDEPPLKRRRGGLNQRIAKVEREENIEAAVAKSHLVRSLKEKWAWGQISPQEVQELAAKSCKDFQNVGAVSPSDLTFLASMGASGAHKKLGLSFVFYMLQVDLKN